MKMDSSITLYIERPNALKILIAAGTNVEAKYIGGLSNYSLPFILDYRQGETAIIIASRRSGYIVKLLVDAGADVNANVDGTALINASANGAVGVVKLLLNAGADVNAVGYKRRTALIHAAWDGHIEVARILIEAGADIHAQTSDQYTAMDYAAGRARNCEDVHQDICDLLIEADLNSQRRSSSSSSD